MRLRLKTPPGEVIDVEVDENATSADVCSWLVEHHNYAASVQLMFGSKILQPNVFMDEFPLASVLVVGQRRESPGHHNLFPQRGTGKDPHRSVEPGQYQEGSSSRNTVDAIQSPNINTDETMSKSSEQHDSSVTITVQVYVPETSEVLSVTLLESAAVVDLVTALRKDGMGEFRLRIFDKYLTNPQEPLRRVPVVNGSQLVAASGVFTEHATLLLHLVQQDVEQVERSLKPFASVSQQLKMSYIERLMRNLMQLDSLEMLEGERKRVRKELVKKVTALQDVLQTEL